MRTEVRRKFSAVTPRFFPKKSNMRIDRWIRALEHHPDPQFRDFVIDGIHSGFSIQHSGPDPVTTHRNLPTTRRQKEKITEWFLRGIEKGYILGPFDRSNVPFAKLFPSPVGAVPKPNGGVRPIHHLSAPKNGISVNSSLNEESRSVEYVKFHEVVEIVDAVGKDGWIWVVDAEDAYLRVPIQEPDWKYIAMEWFGLLFVFTCLTFGLSSACRIYTHFADAIEWIIASHDPSIFFMGLLQLIRHYLDDFFGGHPSRTVAQRQFNCVVQWFDFLGVPTSPSKCQGPFQVLKILGFVYDTVKREVRVPHEKINEMCKLIKEMLRAKRTKKDKIESLVGKLRWASRCVFGGQAFVRRLELLGLKLRCKGHRTPLRATVLGDLRWWLEVLQSTYNGFSFDYLLHPVNNGDITVYCDAASLRGLGGFATDGQWFQYWYGVNGFDKYGDLRRPSIDWLELAALVVAAKMWAPRWSGKAIDLHTDNTTAQYALANKCVNMRRGDLMELVRVMCALAAKYRFYFWVVRVAGKDNIAADALSRFFADPLATCATKMQPKPSDCTQAVTECLDSYFNYRMRHKQCVDGE